MFSYVKSQNTIDIFTIAASFAASAILIPKFLSLKPSFCFSNSQRIATVIEDDQEIVDVFENVGVKWRLDFRPVEATQHRREYHVRGYELTFEKKNENKVLNCYLPYIYKLSKSNIEESKEIRLYQVENDCGGVSEYPFMFDHPALDSEIKATVANDLSVFANVRKSKSKGKARRQSYLLYGPPGSGKSSLVAAMANHLKYDIYDFDYLSKLFEHDPEFLESFISDSCRKSLLVIEDT